MALAGDLIEFSVAGRVFPVPSGEAATIDYGGVSNEVNPNGDGQTARTIRTRKVWMIEVTVECDALRGDPEFLRDTASATEYVACQVTKADGSVYVGRGHITGDMQEDTSAGTMRLTMSGPGTLEKQS